MSNCQWFKSIILCSAVIWLSLAACTPLPTGTPAVTSASIADRVVTSTTAPRETSTVTTTPTLASTPTITLTPSPTTTPTPASSPTRTPTASPTPECMPTDQDNFVWGQNLGVGPNGERLQILSPCIRLSGVVKQFYISYDDGDAIMQLALDSSFQSDRLLWPGNQGAMQIEAVCYTTQRQNGSTEALDICAKNLHPLRDLPSVGQHVWMEGRWVLDRNHAHAELHPLYRWGVLK